MDYTEKYAELEKIFNANQGDFNIPGSGIRVEFSRFLSEGISKDLFSGNDFEIMENQSFSYPVFVPAETGSRKVILLLHGLNERSWNKYLSWAYYLCSETNSYIILFPISFHINRSPLSWRDPRSMMRLLHEKAAEWGEVRNSCFANIALSNRLSDDPRRFVKSGYQTVCDLTVLMNQIRSGKHAFIPGNSQVNIFAYSIGAFLAEIIMMSNPDDLYSGSKLFMFCGGSVFSNMRGESKLIMDKLAYERVYNYYMEGFENEISKKGGPLAALVSGKVGLAFRAMIDFGRLRDFREKAMGLLRDQIYSIGLLKDRVIPAQGIIRTLNPETGHRRARAEIQDFNYEYSHENPFPLLKNGGSSEVDRCFERIMIPACRFLA